MVSAPPRATPVALWFFFSSLPRCLGLPGQPHGVNKGRVWGLLVRSSWWGGMDRSGGWGPPARFRSTCPTPPGWGEAWLGFFPKQPGTGLACRGHVAPAPGTIWPGGAAIPYLLNKGEAVPPGTSCVRGKMAAPGPCCKELKMEDAATRWSGRAGESPTQRKRAGSLAGRCFL